MKKIDAHHHLWKYSPVEHAWINDEMSVLKQDYLPKQLWEEMSKSGYEGCVAVQASQTEQETQFLLQEASVNPFILGVVGWVNLSNSSIKDRLQYFSKFSDFKGVRHVLQDEEDDQFMLREEFLRGIAALKEFDLTYDILIFPKHLPFAKELVEKFPEQPFVIDHIAKPEIKEGKFEPWASDLKKIAHYPNVMCKLSGMVTEADWKQWTKEELHQYIQVVVDAFGVDRLMIGSDWPVCKLAGEYSEVMQVVEDFFTDANDRKKVMGENAMSFYNLTLKNQEVNI
ncbi:amidohydrolase family protein [Flammeovirga yaeyamensis]|uniref:Amidohydrolase family protein n=1 Tax=Flammeovirga yaeyamensis TaxID=367791 RepID=A0AAX1NB19_9BACT|nr:amidohydrolase family protein [Flammeovirga yaeyamensis]MBB3699410.1 L-fuconolactonase [Flammeovirga yaeyamensis]NMF35331.1 amidohydrolase family protein [Flammeovirga yaeyamensis]QWG04191.1 amidohydrolase family protein [Flammeovirga yaeyamensis]